MEGTRILMIATYGMEIVECGGALAKNVQAGGESYAAVVLAREESRPFVLKASEVLGVKTQFLDFRFGEVGPDVPSKLKLVKVIRAIRPDIIICQEPEHSFDDLDPDRRQAMILYLESIALASRDWELDKTPGLKPHPVPTIYYMTPHEPNCILDVAPVWHLKEQAMAQLRTQMAFSAQILRGRVGEEAVQALLGEGVTWTDDTDLGTKLHREMDRAFHIYHGLLTHGNYAFAEPYRRDGKFHLDRLTV